MKHPRFWALMGFMAIVCGAPIDDEISTLEKLQNTIKTMQALLEKQQQRMLSGFDGMRKRVNALEKIADKTKKEIEHSANAVCPILLAPRSGRVLGARKRSVGDLAYYVCDHGYELRGEEERACFNNGSWSGTKPVCYELLPVQKDQLTMRSNCVVRDAKTKMCTCPIGFRLSGDQTTCTDVDECADIGDGNKRIRIAECQHKCRNHPGSYACICPGGFILDEAGKCRDKDECAEGTHNCSLIAGCINTYGGFECVPSHCPKMYIKTGDRLCQKIPCRQGDEDCRAMPYTITYQYMAMTPNVGVPARIFRLTTESGIDRSITRFSVAPGRDSFYFTSRRLDRKTGWLVLYQRPTGPNTLKVDFEAREHRRNGQLIAKHVARIVIYVSEYGF